MQRKALRFLPQQPHCGCGDSVTLLSLPECSNASTDCSLNSLLSNALQCCPRTNSTNFQRDLDRKEY